MNIGIVGLGLIGGSFGKALIKKTEHKVFGYDISSEVMVKADISNAFNEKLTEENAKKLDVIIFSVYPRNIESCLEKFLPYLKDGAIIIDFCGIKRYTVNVMEKYISKYKNLHFIGGHPMAGREYSGIEHAITTLFDKSYMIVVPKTKDIFVLSLVKKLFLEVGFLEVVITSEDNHDQIIAYTSQLCHIVSNAFIKNETAKNHIGFSAGSYKDLTRVAKLNPSMWAELMIENKDKLSLELDELINNLTKYSLALKNNDEEYLKELLNEGNLRKLEIDKR